MAYNSELRNGSDLNEFKIHEACRSDGFSVNHDLYVKYGGVDGCTEINELRALFDQVLSFFLKEVSVNKNAFRPLPPKLGDGQEANLFKLFLTIRGIGSYELVSENNLWEFVARECGIDIALVASLKLIYIKYLKEFDQWLLKEGFKDEKMKSIEIGVAEKLDLLSRQLGKTLINVEIVGLEDGKKKNEGTSGFNQNEGGINLGCLRINGENEDVSDNRCELSPKAVKKVGFSMINDEIKRNELSPDNAIKKVRLSVIHDEDNVVKNVNHVLIDDDDDYDGDDVLNFRDGDGNNIVSHNFNNQKRKREEESLLLSEMLDWVANVARDPHDAAFKTSQRSCKWKNYTSDELWKQALLARRAVFEELNVDSSNEACSSQKKNQRMHPSMYEDDRIQLRCSRRTTSSIPCPTRLKRHKTEAEKSANHETIKQEDQEYNLGPLYQAEVPPWTGVVSESDPKWLGTQMWPPPDKPDGEQELGNLVIGIGRQGSCECVFSGSAECVRFHIAENRFKIKIELGVLFYKWKFNQMGEEVSLAWEPEEEKRFKSLVIRARYELGHSSKSRREIMHRFWGKASELLPAKTKQNMVSYYFNVFVLRRRSYQNRVTPREIDSDNDEEEVGSVGDRFGYEKIHGMSLKCSKNFQCTDLES